MAEDSKDEGVVDKAVGRVKQAAGDLADDSQLKREGSKEENRGEAKDELADAEEKAEQKKREVENRS